MIVIAEVHIITYNCRSFTGDGQWSAWNGWSACSETCGDGTQTRSRSCDNPEPVNDGADCVGHGDETQSCNEGDCPVAGQWSTWLSWSSCSSPCGDGTQIRARYCDNPWPANGGADCDGDAEESQPCNDGDCPDNGQWSTWGSWSGCSVDGVQSRTRTCDEPAPSGGGLDCVGHDTEEQQCDV
ncbi:coadhesin-like [Branchiostoma floridae]|uniref:Coadhesin-like n=1 Tax=Branchiostoma floridae TaxID=7739 RepID=A0A9J7L0N8_BRAFL|nr:coadhesin-like [Branchiostoma floridae]